jgi:hypothetical protein
MQVKTVYANESESHIVMLRLRQIVLINDYPTS